MSELRYKYLVALSESTGAEDLEALLNEKASEGYELFMLHEVDSRMGKTQYNCIFYKMEEDLSSNAGENIEISDITDFKQRIEKIYQTQDTHKEYLELQKKVLAKQKKIQETKQSIEVSTDEKQRQELNERVQEEINELNDLSEKLAKVSDSFKFYNRIKSDKITIYLSDELVELAEKENEDNLIARIIKLREETVDTTGYVIPNIRYTDGVNLEPYQYRIDIREVPAATGYIYPGHRMYYKGQANLTRKPRNSVSNVHPVYMFDVFWVKEEEAKDYWDKGMTPSDVIALHLSYTSVKHSIELLDYKDINKYIDIVRKEDFDLAENVVPDVLSAGDIRYILANLIREMVPIKDITYIFERIMDLYQYAPEKEVLLEKLRIAMRRKICHARVDDNNCIDVIVLDPDIDKYFRDNLVIPDHSNPFINLGKEEIESLMTKTASIIEKGEASIEHTAILCSNSIRQAVFSLYEEFIPGLAVLSHEEIATEVEFNELGSLNKKIFT
jgi:flagellar biosynthesis protein FlhA